MIAIAGIRRFVIVLIMGWCVSSCVQRDVSHEVGVSVRSADRPAVVLENPKSGVLIPWGAEIRIRAAVQNMNAPVVEFGVNDEVIGRDIAAPFEIVHRPRVHGRITVTAQVRDAQGNVIAGDAVTVDVQNPNPSTSMDEQTDQEYAIGMLGPQPLVTLTSPTDGAVFAAADVRVAAEASGPAAGLVRVEFLIDGSTAGTQTMVATEPKAIVRFDYHWKPGAGTHSIVARAIDEHGRIGTTKTATITVR